MLLRITVTDGSKEDSYCIALPPLCNVRIVGQKCIFKEGWVFRDFGLLPNQAIGDQKRIPVDDSFGATIDLIHNSSAVAGDITGVDGNKVNGIVDRECEVNTAEVAE